jgi:putative transposase
VPRTYDAEFRRRVLDLVRAGRPVRVVAAELGLAEATVYRWKAQDLIDRGVKPGTSTSEQGELAAARPRIQEPETELAVVKQAATLFEEGVRPKAKYPFIAELAGQGFSTKQCCRILSVAASGFFIVAASFALTTPTPVRVADGPGASHPRRLPRHLRVAAGLRRADLRPRRDRQPQDRPEDHADRGPARPPRSPKDHPQQGEHGDCRRPGRAPLRPAGTRPAVVTDITEHPTREGKVYCCVVLDVFSRRVVGWSIDSHQATPLVTNALGMAINNRNPLPNQTVIHSDHGSQQCTSWAFTQRAKDSQLLPSMGTIGDAYDNAVIESFWGRMQTELLDRQRWTTASSWPTRSLSTWRSSTTGNDATMPWAGSPPSSTRSATPPTSPDSHTPRSTSGAQIRTGSSSTMWLTESSLPGRRTVDWRG